MLFIALFSTFIARRFLYNINVAVVWLSYVWRYIDFPSSPRSLYHYISYYTDHYSSHFRWMRSLTHFFTAIRTYNARLLRACETYFFLLFFVQSDIDIYASTTSFIYDCCSIISRASLRSNNELLWNKHQCAFIIICEANRPE